jgi:hypothetical protein
MTVRPAMRSSRSAFGSRDGTPVEVAIFFRSVRRKVGHACEEGFIFKPELYPMATRMWLFMVLSTIFQGAQFRAVVGIVGVGSAAALDFLGTNSVARFLPSASCSEVRVPPNSSRPVMKFVWPLLAARAIHL